MRVRQAMIILAVAFGAAASAATVTVEANGEHTLTAAENVRGNEIVLSAGSTLRLPSGAGDFTLRPYIRLVGSATLDTGDATSLVVDGGLYATAPSYALTVDGLGSFAFGRDNGGTWGNDNYFWPRLDISTVNFTAGAPASIALTNDVAAFVLPSCTVSIAKGARIIAMDTTKPFTRFLENSKLTVSGWTAIHGRSDAIGAGAAVTVQVEPDGAYYVMPRYVNNDLGDWGLAGFSITQTWSAFNNWQERVVLNGEGAKFGMRLETAMQVNFACNVTGTGDVVVVKDGNTSGRCSCCLWGAVDIAGTLSVTGRVDCTFAAGAKTSGALDVRYPVRIGGSLLAAGALADGCDLRLTDLGSFTLNGTGGVGSKVTVESGDAAVDLSGAVQPLPEVSANDGTKIGLKTPSGVTMPINPVWPQDATNWRAKVTLHFDASDSASLIRYPGNVCYTNGFPVISGWLDQKSKTGGGYALRALRGLNSDGSVKTGDEHQETCPYLVPGGLNGKDYICFGAFFGNKIPANYGTANGSPNSTVNEARRMELFYSDTDATVASAGRNKTMGFAIMVFGSQQGGGRALLGTSDGVFDRGGSTLASPVVAASGYPVHLDGVEIDPTVGGQLNGGWQIVSIDMNGCGFRNIGMLNAAGNAYTTAGGQNYAEIVMFESEPTATERLACERYLAEKWGLAESYRQPMLPTLSMERCESSLLISGSAALEGVYLGTATVPAGTTLVLGGHTPIPGEEAVVADNRVAWFDPSCPGTFGAPNGGFVPSRDVWALLSRDENGAMDTDDSYFFAGYYDDTYDRCPWTNISARGNGPAMPWMDFRHPEGDEVIGGKALRSRKGRSGTFSRGSTVLNQLPDTREAYLVLDTSRGGGNVLGVNSTALGWSNLPPGVREGRGQNIVMPVWSNPAGVFATATARLDNVEFDATTTGYHGRPEVFSFATESAFNPSVLAAHDQCYPSETGNNQGEIIGEVVFYSVPLSAEARARLTAHLAFKWFGKVMDGYSDVSGARVVGAGKVRLSAGNEGLPDLSGFAGTVDCTCTNLTFSLGAGGTVSGAIVSAGAVSLEGVSSVTLAAAGGTFAIGEYTLAAGSPLAVNPSVRYSLSGTMPSDCRIRFRQTATAWTVTVSRIPGITVNFR